MISRKLVALVILAAFVPAAAMAADATLILRKSTCAAKSVNYRGMKIARVYYCGGTMTAVVKVAHLRPDKTRTEYLTPKSLSGVILLQNGRSLWEFLPTDKIWEPASSRLLPLSDQASRDACQNYNVKILGMGMVAGRPTFVVRVTPRCRGESSRTVWVDKQWFLVLRNQVESPKGKVVSSSEFSSIRFNPNDISPDLFTNPTSRKPSPRVPAVNFKPAIPSYLPPGYREIARGGLLVEGYCCAHLQYSNGVNGISLFERRDTREYAPIAVDSRCSHVLTWAHDGILFTVVGDVSSRELERIANSCGRR